MPPILYGKSSYLRENGNLPEFKLVNMFVEQAPVAEGGVVLQSRPGLAESATRGTGPINGIFSQEGTFDGDVFTLSGDTLYREDAILGTVLGDGPISWAASAIEVVITRGGSAYSYDGTDLAAIAFPDGAEVAAVAIMANIFIFIREGTHNFYWSAVLDARAIDSLDFASAETRPDNLLDVVSVGPFLFLLGEETTEVWTPGGPVDLPFSRIEGRLYRKGVLATGCAREQDNALTIIGNDGIVYRISDVPQRISDHGIEERIEASDTAAAFTFIHEGHNFFCVRLEEGTWAFDVATGQWCEFQTYERDNFRAQCAATQGRTVLLGDDEDGTVWGLSGYLDGEAHLMRLFTAAFPIRGGSVAVDSLDVETNTGWTEDLSGQGADPVLEMRSSRSASATWGDYKSAPLGAQGEYRQRTRYRRVGRFDAPAGVFEFRCSDPVPLRVSGVNVNEPGGGRSR